MFPNKGFLVQGSTLFEQGPGQSKLFEPRIGQYKQNFESLGVRLSI